MGNEFWDEYNRLKNKKKKNETEDIAPVRTSNVETSANTDTETSFWSVYEKEKARVEEWRNENTSKRSDDGKSIVPVNYKRDSDKEEKPAGSKVTKETDKKESEKDKRTWFQKGAFSDGYQFGDAFKSFMATGSDLALGIVEGLGTMGEGVLDAGVHLVGYVADELGADSFAQKAHELANKNEVQELFQSVRYNAGADENGVFKDSLLGAKSRGVNNALGQIGGVIITGGAAAGAGMSAAGASAVTMGTMGASSFGSGVSEAYNSGTEDDPTSDAEAFTYGAISAASDVVSEMIFGGLGKQVKILGVSHGLSSADDVLAKTLSNKISSTLGKNLVEWGVKAGAEGLEEVIAGFGQAVGKKVTYMSEEELWDIVQDENLLEQFVVGALASGVAQAPSVHTANKAGVDYVSGLTANEEAVVNRVVEDTIAEAEKNGTKLSAKEKNDIREKVQTDMERGRISTDTIEEVLGGESYKAYTDAVAKEDALRKEYADLGKLQNPTLEQSTRYKELHDQRDTFTKDETRNALRGKVRDYVLGLVQGTRLAESYAEQARRGEYFADDLTTYKNEYARKSVENLVNSKAANNTNRTREMAETVAKIAQDKNITFDFTTDEKIKADGKAYISKKNITADGNAAVFDLGAKNLDADFTPVVTVNGKAVDGFKVDYENGTITFTSAPEAGEIHVEYRRSGSVNGYYDKQNRVVTVNLNSPKAWQFIVGHEVTHSLEGTDSYKELSRAIAEYAKTKGDYDGRWDALSSAYNSGTDIDTEITSDLVGEYLFTDEAFVQHLSTNHRNVFQRIYDEIKHLYKMVTAGSKEARELEKVKYAFEKAWRAQAETSTDNSGGNGDVNYNITVLEDGKTYVSASRNVINGTTLEDQRRDITKFFNDLLQGNPSLDIPTIEGDILTITKADTADKARDNYKQSHGQRIKMTDEEFAVKLRVESHIDEVAEVSEKAGGKADNKKHEFAKDGFTYRRAFFEDFDGKYYEITLSIGQNGTVATVYNVRTTKKGVPPSAKTIAVVGSKPLGGTPSASIIAENSEKSSGNSKNLAPFGGQYSISVDSEGNKLTPEQQERFKDSKVRDENGNLKVMYHGTPNGDFTVFKDGTYFTDNKAYADLYQNPGASSISVKNGASAPKTFEVYLDIKKPFDISDPAARDIYINEYIKGGNAVGINPYLSDTEYDKISSIDWTEGEDLRDFLQENGYDYDGLVLDEGATGGYGEDVKYRGKAYVVFSPEQVKNIDNIAPTNDPDIRFSLAIDSDYISAVERGDTDSAQKMVYEAARNAGYTIKAYHGTPNTEFTVFDKDRLGKGNDQYGAGFYFASDKEGASHYGNRVIDSVLDIKNPIRITAAGESGRNLIDADIELTSKQAYEVVKRHPYMYDDEESPLGDYFDSYWESGAQEWMVKELAEQYRDVGYLDSDLFRNYPNELHEALRDVVGWDGAEVTFERTGDKFYVAWFDNQMKSSDPVTYDDNGNVIPLSERFNAKNNDIRRSLSSDTAPVMGGNWRTPARDLRYEGAEDIAPSAPAEVATDTNAGRKIVSEADFAPIPEAAANAMQDDLLANVRDEYAPPEMAAPYYDEDVEQAKPTDPFEAKDIETVGKRNIKAYMYENPEVKPFFQKEANYLLGELQHAIKGERTHLWGDFGGYGAESYHRVIGTKRSASPDIEYLLDTHKYSYDQIEKGIKAILEDNGAENNAVSKRIEFILNDRLRDGYQDWETGMEIPPDEGYLNLLREKEITEYNEEAFKRLVETADDSVIPPAAEDIAPARETVDDPANDVAPAADDVEITTTKERITSKLNNTQTELDNNKRLRAEAKAKYAEQIESLQKLYDSKKNKNTKAANNILRRIERLKRLSGNVDADYAKRISDLETRTSSLGEQMNQDHTRADALERAYARIDRNLEADRAALDEEFAQRRASLTASLADRNSYISSEAGKLYDEISSLRKGVRASKELGYLLDLGYDWNSLKAALAHTKRSPGAPINTVSEVEAAVRDTIAEGYEAKSAELSALDGEYGRAVERLEAEAEAARNEARNAEDRFTRKALHQTLVENVRTGFAERGYDLDAVLKNAKDLSTFATVDNTPQRVMEKSLGYKEGGILADMTVNKVAQNESEAIKWLNTYTDKKNGLLAQLSRQYRIKPGSKESAAAQMYAEGFYVNKHDEIIQYGDNELAADFPDRAVQDRIKGLASDPRIRLVYDQTLDLINDSRTRNAYPEIQKLDNYFLHFRAMDDTFSKLGLPFNPNDIRAKDLPTDLNGVTADLLPGQPYFASAMHREGKRTSFDLLGGLERYLAGAKNQIFHIDDIQTLRALRNYIADSYGQAKGLESLDALTEEEVQDRIKEVYGSHLSTFAKFLNEEANIIAGKTSLADRGLEGIIGRRGITFLDSVNKQVGANMVGFNVSSSLTNFLPVVQTFAKANKGAFVKAFAQTVSNKLGAITGKSDGFADESTIMIRRKGADRFYRTPWQKMSDPGYFLMGAVDDISTEIIARTKYNELTSKGMASSQAHYETDKWVSRLMGDRSLGQQPHLYNSKMLGLITKFQLEVRNQLDSMFYDTIQDAKVSNEDVENGLARNAKTAAKVASTFFQLAVAQHVFGKVFESIAGYNPAFDIIEVISTAFGWDDDDDSEDTVLDNIEQGFLTLLEDLPYTSTLTGGRIPISSALPITEFIKGKDQYGNEKSRWDTLAETAPYYLMPGGYGQAKKTIKGLRMFDDDLPVSGSYTDSGNLRFPVEDTVPNRIQAALFGQWASNNARDYFDNERKPLAPKQIEEYKQSEMTIGEYWDYREGLSGLSTIEEKAAYINSLDIPLWKKTYLVNNLTDRKDQISMEDYEKYGSVAESDFANENPARYELMKQNGVTYEQYKTFSDEKKNAYSWASKNPEKYEFIKSIGYTIDDYAAADDDKKEAWTWAYNNPEKYAVSKAVSDDLFEYRRYASELDNIKADKDENGKSISGSRKDKVIDYINGMDADFGEKIILFKMEYPADDTYNNEIIDYINDLGLSYGETKSILETLGFKVSADGYITWD